VTTNLDRAEALISESLDELLEKRVGFRDLTSVER